MNTIIKLTLVMLAVATAGVLSKAQAADSIVGTWGLVSVLEEDTESKAVRNSFGDHPFGFLTYTADGRMIGMFVDPARTPAAGPKTTDAEAAQLYRTMVAYAGRYTLEGDKITHHVEVSWNQAWTGTDQRRFIEIKEDHLTVKTPPFVNPITGKQIISTAVLERTR
jgi:Lipocalin-like domain